MAWNRKKSVERIRDSIKSFPPISVTRLTRDANLNNLGLGDAYLVDGVHVYVDILNAGALLLSDKEEGERAHKRYLRLLHIYQRLAHLERIPKLAQRDPP